MNSKQKIISGLFLLILIIISCFINKNDDGGLLDDDVSTTIEDDLDIYEIAELYFKDRSKKKEIISFCKKIIINNQNNYKSYLVLSIMYTEEGDYEQVIKQCDKAINNMQKNDILNPYPYFFKANALYELGMYKQAKTLLTTYWFFFEKNDYFKKEYQILLNACREKIEGQKSFKSNLNHSNTSQSKSALLTKRMKCVDAAFDIVASCEGVSLTDYIFVVIDKNNINLVKQDKDLKHFLADTGDDNVTQILVIHKQSISLAPWFYISFINNTPTTYFKVFVKRDPENKRLQFFQTATTNPDYSVKQMTNKSKMPIILDTISNFCKNSKNYINLGNYKANLIEKEDILNFQSIVPSAAQRNWPIVALYSRKLNENIGFFCINSHLNQVMGYHLLNDYIITDNYNRFFDRRKQFCQSYSIKTDNRDKIQSFIYEFTPKDNLSLLTSSPIASDLTINQLTELKQKIFSGNTSINKKIEQLEEIRKAEKEFFGELNQVLLFTQINLITLYSYTKYCKRILFLYEKAFTHSMKLNGLDHPITLSILMKYCQYLKIIGKYEKSREFEKKSDKSINKLIQSNQCYDNQADINFLILLGLDFHQTNDLLMSESLLLKALKCQIKIPETTSFKIPYIEGCLAALYLDLYNHKKANEYLKNGLLNITKLVSDSKTIDYQNFFPLAPIYSSLADSYFRLMQYDQSENIRIKLIKLYEKGDINSIYNNINHEIDMLSNIYIHLGEHTKAKFYFLKNLKLKEKVYGTDHPKTYETRGNLANLYLKLGDYKKAKILFKHNLEIDEKTVGKDHEKTGVSLNNLGLIYHAEEKFSIAEELYEKALSLLIKKPEKNQYNIIKTRGNIALLNFQIGKVERAFELFQEINNPIGTGLCYLHKKQYFIAIRQFNEELKDYEAKKVKENCIVLYILIARAYEGLKDYNQAKDYYKKAIQEIEFQRKKLLYSLRESYITPKIAYGVSRFDAYEGLIRVLFKENQKGFEAKALYYLESVKSSMFRDMLKTREIVGKSKIDKKILSEDKAYQRKIAFLKKNILSLNDEADNNIKKQKEKELKLLLDKYESFIKDVKLQNSELASLISDDVPNIPTIQSLLRKDTSVLELFLTKDSTYAWIITANNIQTHVLPNGKIYLSDMTNKLRKIDDNTIKEEKNRKLYTSLLHQFYNDLFKPLIKDIETSNLIIVPHGVLHKVPFSAFYDGTNFIVDKLNISISPSLSLLSYVKHKRNPYRNKFVAFAKPRTQHGFLLHSEAEVVNIASLFSKSKKFFWDSATKEIVRKQLIHHDVIHFSCHAELNENQPLQSSLILTPGKDNNDDGRLQVHEIFSLNLQDANLVTLSACNTALGTITKGDDMIGLTRAFIYAGTPSILASLWRIDDKSTMLLMEQFYKNWRSHKMTKPEALRKAQMFLKSQKISEKDNFSHPYYWAGFQIIGDWL